jgi:hypothetical protein
MRYTANNRNKSKFIKPPSNQGGFLIRDIMDKIINKNMEQSKLFPAVIFALAAFFGMAGTASASFNIAKVPANYEITKGGGTITLYGCPNPDKCEACKWPGTGISAVLSKGEAMSLQIRHVCIDPANCYMGDQKRKDAVCVENLTGTFDSIAATFDITGGSGPDGQYDCSGNGAISDDEITIGKISCRDSKGNTQFEVGDSTRLERLSDQPEGSGIKFSGLSGQVEIQLPGQTAWHLCNLDTVIPVDAHIKTAEDSTAIISCSDMSTFVLKPETEIVTTTPPSQGGKLQILAGNLWANVKKMVKDGNMEVEMTQAVAGIKGTTFVVSDDGKNSTLKVIEGKVSFASKADNKTTLVTAGETITADNGGSLPEQAFNIASESKTWDAIRNVPKNPDKPTPDNAIWYIITAAVAIILVVACLKFAKKKTQP